MRSNNRIFNGYVVGAFLLVISRAPLPPTAFAHGGHEAPAPTGGARNKMEKPTHKTEEAALEELSFLVRDLEKRMRIGDVEGVHEGAWEIGATADNLWMVGLKKKDVRNRKTINAYMNLLKMAAQELSTYEGKEDIESGREILSRVRDIYGNLRKQYLPESKKESHSGPHSHSADEVPQIGPDTGSSMPRKSTEGNDFDKK